MGETIVFYSNGVGTNIYPYGKMNLDSYLPHININLKCIIKLNDNSKHKTSRRKHRRKLYNHGIG